MKDRTPDQYQEKSNYSDIVEDEMRQLDRMHEGNKPGDEDLGKFYHSNMSNKQNGPAGGK